MKNTLLSLLLLVGITAFGQPYKKNPITTNDAPAMTNVITAIAGTSVGESGDDWFQPYVIGQNNHRNQYSAWPRFNAHLYGSTAPSVPYQVFGWGEAGHFGGIYGSVLGRIWKVAPCAGIIGLFGNYQSYVFSGSYYTNVGFGHNYTQPVVLPASATLSFTNSTVAIKDTFATRILEIVFIKTNIGGVFMPYVSTEGGAWTAMTMTYSGATTVGTSTNGYGAEVIRWTNSTWTRPQQLMVSNVTASPVFILSLGGFNDGGGGAIANGFIQNGSPHWQGFFDGYVGDGSDQVDRTNMIRPMWSNWFSAFPTLCLYHEFVQQSNWVTYLPRFHDYLTYVAGGVLDRTKPANEWIFIGPQPDTGEWDGTNVLQAAGFETNFISSSIELHDFTQTNRLIAATGLGTNYPWRIGFFDQIAVYGTTQTNAWRSDLITNLYDWRPTQSGIGNAGNALYTWIGGDSLFASRDKRFVSALPAMNSNPTGALQVNGLISTFGSSAGLQIVQKTLADSFYLTTPPSGDGIKILYGSTDIFSYTNRGGGYNFFRFGGAISPDPFNGFYFINTNSMEKIPGSAGHLQNSATYRGQAILANDNGTVKLIESGANGTTWLWTNSHAMIPRGAMTTDANNLRIWNSNNAALYVRGTNGVDTLLLAIP